MVTQGLRVYTCLHSTFNSPLKDHKPGLKTIKHSISGQRLVDWLVDEKLVESRKEGVAFGAHLMATGLMKHGEYI